jgi:homoserine trans-succinylase
MAGQSYCDAICIGGLRISPQIKLELLKVGEDFSEMSDDFHLKNFDEEIENKVLKIYDELALTVPLFKHSSCAVSYINKIANYNNLYKNASKNCLTTCPLNQKNLCNHAS